jgi:hypothetical protein
MQVTQLKDHAAQPGCKGLQTKSKESAKGFNSIEHRYHCYLFMTMSLSEV